MLEYRLAKARVAGSNPVSRLLESVAKLSIIDGFVTLLSFFNKPYRFSVFSMHFSPQTDGSLSVHFESWHAVYSDYMPGTTKASPVLPWFSF